MKFVVQSCWSLVTVPGAGVFMGLDFEGITAEGEKSKMKTGKSELTKEEV